MLLSQSFSPTTLAAGSLQAPASISCPSGPRQTKRIFPPGPNWFRALDLAPLDRVKVVILGQDPYHGLGQAHGLCFSVPQGVQPPPSLVNIFKELKSDLGIEPARHGFLEHWASQGVLLLNSVLTVEMGRAASHRDRGWERFTDAVMRAVNATQTSGGTSGVLGS